jgi:micrococcal nuclease
MRRALLCIAVLATACRDVPSPSTSAPAGATTSTLLANATLVRVIDGDTVDVTVDGTQERVRLIGIDTPETKKEGTPVQCFGPEASAFTVSLLPTGTALHLERDVEARDPYGRLLAYVYRADDGLFVNLEIIRRGYARLLTIPPNLDHADDFVDAAESARDENAGLWAGCTG